MLFERVTFHDEENGSCVPRLKARGLHDLVTVVGHAAMVFAGEGVRAAGIRSSHRTLGLLFQAELPRSSTVQHPAGHLLPGLPGRSRETGWDPDWEAPMANHESGIVADRSSPTGTGGIATLRGDVTTMRAAAAVQARRVNAPWSEAARSTPAEVPGAFPIRLLDVGPA
ncbi:YrrC family ATP-dependent DNA helicase [Lichenibacterium dinghuense]|uniref:YrrC family ATP-dependent DNA helicase n=1 Tax=Lichenibacterium dinghuense TaxID=2895977 RepID=UPI001F3B60AB|nr:hypothetical protein [Lichenibacterium sp. 6Y81]